MDMAVTVEDVIDVGLLIRRPILQSDSERDDFVAAVRKQLDLEAIVRDEDHIEIPSKQVIVRCGTDAARLYFRYPAHKKEIKLLAQVISIALSVCTLPDPVNLMWSITLVYQQDKEPTVPRYLGPRLLKEVSLDDDGLQMLGGHATLHFFGAADRGNRAGLWIVEFAPRFNDPEITRIFFDLDRYVNDGHIEADESTIIEELENIWDFAHSLIDRVDSSD